MQKGVIETDKKEAQSRSNPPIPDSNSNVEGPLQEYYERRNELLKNTDQTVIRKAWFTLSHLLLDEGSHVVDMGCHCGELLFVMAVLAPNIRFTGVDISKRQINKARELYQDKVHNLEYMHGDIGKDIFKPNSIDAIINCDILHVVYSSAHYNEEAVRQTLKTHYDMLKPYGTLYIRDFARPPPEDYVMIELPDKDSLSDNLQDLSESDLLLWYSEHARPKHDHGCGGFFLEELPPRIPKTRLFRLPYKWAYEFIMRKDNRDSWERELPMEYTFFTQREFRKELRGIGARVQYCGPYWDDDIIEDKFEGKFRLYQDNGKSLGHPPTCYVAVARKIPERKSIRILERRPSDQDQKNLKISAMRNEKTGEIHDIVTRDISPSEILPFRIHDDGRLKLYLHDGIPRGVINTVPRNGVNIDKKRWSGHMIEPIAVDQNIIHGLDKTNYKSLVLFSRDYLGLKPKPDNEMIHGPDYYPAPDYIDEQIETYFLNVEQSENPAMPKNLGLDEAKFQSKGKVLEFDAQQILNAISVGMIPSGRLELQIIALIEHLNLKAENWSAKSINLQKQEITRKTRMADVIALLENSDKRFKDVKGTVGDLRAVNSIFVEEAINQGGMNGLKSQNLNFVISDERTINTVVVLPLTKNLKGDVHAGFLINHMPAIQRQEGKSATISAPTFNIPRDITNGKQIKKFIAKKFNILPEMVIKMGESYYSHIGMTPQRIYPYAIAAPHEHLKDPDTYFMPMEQMRALWNTIEKDVNTMVVMARGWQYLDSDIKMDYELRSKAIVKQQFAGEKTTYSTPISYVAPPGKDNNFHTSITNEQTVPPPTKPKQSIPTQETRKTTDETTPKPFHQKTVDEKASTTIQNIVENTTNDNADLDSTEHQFNSDSTIKPEKW